jgi:hypothetical protein
VLGDLLRAVREFPYSRSALQAVVLTGPAVIGVHVRRHDDVTKRERRPQSASHAHEQQGRGIEFRNRTFGEHCGRVVALTDLGKGYPAIMAR